LSGALKKAGQMGPLLFHFLKINIIPGLCFWFRLGDIRTLSGVGRTLSGAEGRTLSGVEGTLSGVEGHPVLHVPEPLFDLPAGQVHRYHQFKNELK